MEKSVIRVFENENVLLESFATFLIRSANEAIEEKDSFNLCLSGGNSPKKLYSLLASETYRNLIPWYKVHFFFSDERYVAADSLESNALMAKTLMLQPLGIPLENIHVIDTSLSPQQAANAYQKELEKYFQRSGIEFDLILLGLGGDGHTASLFPFSSILSDEQPAVKMDFIKKMSAFRITLNAPLINQAHQIAFLVYGQSKAEAVSYVLGKDVNIEKFPAQLIHSSHGLVFWFLDREAASVLNNDIDSIP